MLKYRHINKSVILALLTVVAVLIGIFATGTFSYAVEDIAGQPAPGNLPAGTSPGLSFPGVGSVGTGVIGGSTNLGFGLDPVNPNDPSLPYTVVDSNGNATQVSSGNAGQPQGDGGSVGWFFDNIWNTIAQLLYIIFVSIPAMLAALAGMLLNYSITYFIIDMSGVINVQTGIGYAINMLWQVIRDTMNILFIFGLIYIGIKTILNSEDSGTRRTLGLLIAAALFINFSLFIAKAIIDFTNILAVQINSLMGVSASATGTATGFSVNYFGISGAFFEAVGLTQITNTPVTSIMQNSSDAFSALAPLITFMAASMIFFVVLAIVFFAGAIMVFTRFVALIIYMIFSPVMFLGWIMPAFKQYTTMWLDGFLKNAFFAPAYMFMLYLSLITVTQLRMSLVPGSSINYLNAVKSDPSAFMIIMVYAFAIAMLVASIIVAQKMSIWGSGTGMGMLKSARANIQGYMGRNFIAKPSSAMMKWMDRQNENSQAKTWAGRRLQTAARGTAKFAGNMSDTANAMTFGALGTSSNRGRLDKLANSKFGSDESLKDIKDADKALKQKQSLAYTTQQLKDNIATGTKDGALDTQLIAMERAVANASQSQLEELGAKTLKQEKVAGALSQSQFESIMKSDKFTDIEKGEIAAARKTSVEGRLAEKNKEGETIRVKVEDASTAQLTALGGEYLSEPTRAVWLGEKQMDELEKKLTETEFNRIKESRKDALDKVTDGTDVGGFDMNALFKKKPGELAKLPADIIKKEAVAKRLTSDTLAKIVTDGTQNHATQATIRKIILESGTEDILAEGYGKVGERSTAPQADWLQKTTIGRQFGA